MNIIGRIYSARDSVGRDRTTLRSTSRTRRFPCTRRQASGLPLLAARPAVAPCLRAACALFLAVCVSAAGESGCALWRFRIGPVFETGRSTNGLEVLAVRPLFSRVTDAPAHESLTDVVWPWSSFHRRDDYFHWWAFPAFDKDENVNDPLARHTFWLLPIYCQGRTRDGDDFSALFPIHGTIRDFIWLDELHFTLFPLYLNYRQGRQETESYCWPIYSHETGPIRERQCVFPVYGTSTTAIERSSFLLWPIWTQQEFDGPNRRGTAEMLFPIYGRVDTDTQQGWMALPPLFSRMTMTNGDTSLRCPWPIYETAQQKDSERNNVWPLWTRTETTNGHRGTIAWPFWWEDSVDTGGRREHSETLLLFYRAAHSEIRTGDRYVADLDYVRVWPFYSRNEAPEGTRIRVPELTFMRDGQGIERNWAPFWSWYVQHRQAGACDHDVFWGLARWGRQCDDTTYVQLGPLISWQQPPDGSLEWRFLGGLLGHEGIGAAARYRLFWFWTSGGTDGPGDVGK